MHIIDYKSITGTEDRGDVIAIPELNPKKVAAPQFVSLADLNIELTVPTAFLYIGGATVSSSEAGLGTGEGVYFPAIKTGASYIAHMWASTFKNLEYLTQMQVIEGTCAAGIHAINQAFEMLYSQRRDAVSEVIIIGHERITPDTTRLFKELGIPITCGDGFVYMRLGKGFDIADVKWKWAHNPNPFVFSWETLDTLLPGYRIGYVKLHGTGTEANETAEAGLAELATPVRYKDKIGHTQGISALIETCLVMDDPNIRGRILVTANGLGGYYGAFTLTKPNARNI
ncbi:MAG: hypothetical protein V3S69_07285 [Dehalococcoidales bacterium]